MIPTLIRAFEASAVLGPYLIAKFSDTAASSKIAGATTNADPIVGATGSIGAVAVGDMVDITLSGIALVTAGGTITAGALLTVDANSKAIVAVPTAGVFMNVIGKALEPAVANDVFQFLAMPVAFYRGT
jgi:hypothetical protein